MRRLRQIPDERGAAAAEMALILPLLLILIFGGIEAGHFVWTQHKLVEAVRDGARYASRLPITELCDGSTEVMSTTTEDKIKLITRTGQLANTSAAPKVPGWTSAQVSVNPNCGAFVSTGLYIDYAASYGSGGPVVVVTANGVTYPSLFNGLGILTSAISMRASSISAGIGL